MRCRWRKTKDITVRWLSPDSCWIGRWVISFLGGKRVATLPENCSGFYLQIVLLQENKAWSQTPNPRLAPIFWITSLVGWKSEVLSVWFFGLVKLPQYFNFCKILVHLLIYATVTDCIRWIVYHFLFTLGDSICVRKAYWTKAEYNLCGWVFCTKPPDYVGFRKEIPCQEFLKNLLQGVGSHVCVSISAQI